MFVGFYWSIVITYIVEGNYCQIEKDNYLYTEKNVFIYLRKAIILLLLTIFYVEICYSNYYRYNTQIALLNKFTVGGDTKIKI